jgi:hypothetical protein
VSTLRNSLVGKQERRSGLEGKLGFAAKYRQFGESWRITQATSLFTYAHGRNTSSYTDRSIPAQLRTARSVPPRVRAAAAAACRKQGVTRPAILRDCMLDVGVTKEPAFASSAATLQRAARLHGVPTSPGAPPSGGSARATRFASACDADVPPDANGQIPVGTDAGIEIDLQSGSRPSPADGRADPHPLARGRNRRQRCCRVSGPGTEPATSRGAAA